MIYKIISLILRYTIGKELVWTNGKTCRSVLSGKYLRAPKKIVFHNSFNTQQ